MQQSGIYQRMNKRIIIIIGIVLSLARASYSLPLKENRDEVWLFTSFREPATEGLRYLYSEDGLHWDSIPGVWLKPLTGAVMRDPSITQGPDGTFHLVWTTQWKGCVGFGYSSSNDLIHWSERRIINVMDSTKTSNVWAPELFYDEEKEQYLIIWSSQINEDDYTDEDRKGTNAAQRMYYCTTKDFFSFSETRPYYDPGFNSIDGFLLKKAPKDYVLIVKDNRKPGYSNLFCVSMSEPTPPFPKREGADSLTRSQTFGRTYSEGPCAIQVENGEWIIYYDQYKPQEYDAVKTKDFMTFTPIHDLISLPSWHKHGTIIKVSRDIIDALLHHK